MAGRDPPKLTRNSLEQLEHAPMGEPQLHNSHAAVTVKEEQFHSFYQQQGMALLGKQGLDEHGPIPSAQVPSKFPGAAAQMPAFSAEQLNNDLKLVQGLVKATNEHPVKRYLTPGNIADPFHVAKSKLDDLQTPYASGESIERRDFIAQLNFDGIKGKMKKSGSARSSDMNVQPDHTLPGSNRDPDSTHLPRES
ncbi:predicted protein [Uncinocarpus reesii 1704]|uniref:Uncharacterized protein n=1 Tax=Uncinocarpus reesii (strain UAMH 1704) TaxID=336963 RepID=C4JZK4_UNCRE|nr:uncharacterized protein UREG_07605 [Uncinocarpus reesii 1704]EEP82740.1 predicted protein [Uncinocarpus reesii 1704]